MYKTLPAAYSTLPTLHDGHDYLLFVCTERLPQRPAPCCRERHCQENLAAECHSHKKWEQLFLDGVNAICRPSYSPQESQRQSCQSPISVHATLTDFPKHVFNLYPPSVVPSVIVTLGMSGSSLQRNRFSSRRLKRSPHTTETRTNYTTEH